MLNILDKYKEIATYLKEDYLIQNIDLMKKAINNKEFLLSFVGQFSAGKSKLINNIIGQDILPVHISETTQVVTFIRYSPIEYANIFYTDLTQKEVRIEEVKEIWQGNIESNSKSIKYIDIYINSNLLKSGVIIADTPGVNTIITNHENITNDVLKYSEEIIYVISKPLTDIDVSFIRQILKMGLNISLVRSFMDKIKVSEENPLEVVEEDINRVLDIFKNENIQMYHVSNEKLNEWHKNTENIKTYIVECLAINIEKKIEESCNKRLDAISIKMLDELNYKKNSLELLFNGDIEKFNNEKEEVEKKIKSLKDKLNYKKDLLKEEINNAKDRATKDLNETKYLVINNGTREIENISYNNKSQEIIKNTAFKLFNEAYEQLQDIYVSPFNAVVEECNHIIKSELDNIDLNNVININEITCDSIEEMALENEYNKGEVEQIKRELINIKETLKLRDEALSECVIEKEENSIEKEEISKLVKEIEEDIKKLGVYQPKYIENEINQTQPSEVMRSLGSMLDLATLFIPGKAYTTIGSKVAKVSKSAGKMISSYKKYDKIKDGLQAAKIIYDKTKVRKEDINKVIKGTKDLKNKAGSVGLLDYLTFEYWFEKVGSQFDTPITMEVDREYEMEFIKSKSELTQKYNEIKMKEIEKLQAVGLIKTEEEKIKKMKEIDIRRKSELENELKRKEEEIRRQALINSFNNFKKEYSIWFENKIKDLSNFIKSKADSTIFENIDKYSDKILYNINYEISNWEKKNEELIELFNNSEAQEIKKEIILCEEYCSFLKR